MSKVGPVQKISQSPTVIARQASCWNGLFPLPPILHLCIDSRPQPYNRFHHTRYLMLRCTKIVSLTVFILFLFSNSIFIDIGIFPLNIPFSCKSSRLSRMESHPLLRFLSHPCEINSWHALSRWCWHELIHYLRSRYTSSLSCPQGSCVYACFHPRLHPASCHWPQGTLSRERPE